MSMTKRIALGFLPAAALALAACGGGGGDAGIDGSGDAPSTLEGGWELVWNDEFNGDAIDSARWEHEYNCWGGGNNEQQCYTDRAENSFVSDGVLNIVARREDFSGPRDPEGAEGTPDNSEVTLPYTSARLRTRNLAEWTYGRFEMRARMPFGQGTWPAFWMLPTDSPYGGWAAGGEIDIVETANLKTDTPNGDRIHATLHYGRAWPQNVSSGTNFRLPGGANPADDFHTYAIEWEEGTIRWYVDDIHYATQVRSGWYTQYEGSSGTLINGFTNSPFDTDFHLLLNLAVGGAFPGMEIDETVFPQTFMIDWVRVYRCGEEGGNGKGCANVSGDAKMVEGNRPPRITTVDPSYAQPPEFILFDDRLAEGQDYLSYDPDEMVEHAEEDAPERGKILTLDKVGATGNIYFASGGGAINMSAWRDGGDLVFDYRVNSSDPDVELVVKIDSGWPAVSGVSVPVSSEWQEFRINLAELEGRGTADLSGITNTFVIEPTGTMNVSFDNIRLVVP